MPQEVAMTPRQDVALGLPRGPGAEAQPGHHAPQDEALDPPHTARRDRTTRARRGVGPSVAEWRGDVGGSAAR